MVADTGTLIGEIAAVLAAVAAVPAAVFSARAFYRMKQDGQAAEKRHVAQIQPRPVVERSDLRIDLQDARSAKVRIGFSNPGGAATMWFAFIQVGEYLFYRRAPVPAHYRLPLGEFEVLSSFGTRTPPTAGSTHTILASYALDVEENGWDVIAGVRTPLPLTEYLHQRLAPLGITFDEDPPGQLQLRPLFPPA